MNTAISLNNSKLTVNGGVIADTKLTITPTSSYKKTRFENVLFLVTASMEEFHGKRVFDHCEFVNCHGLPAWVKFISR